MERREVEAWIEANCRPSRRGDDLIVRWRASPEVAPVTVQIVFGALDVPVVVLYAELVSRTTLDLESALANNKWLSVGGIALDGDHLVLRHVLPLDTLTPPQIERALRQLAGEASRIRSACVRDVRAHQILFAHYTL